MKKLWFFLLAIAMMAVLCLPALAAEELVPVVAQVPDDWTEVYLYAWAYGNDLFDESVSWPGTPMTRVGSGMFCTYIPDDMEYVIINDGNGYQTADLSVTPGQPIFVAAADISSATVYHELPIEIPSAEELGVSLPSGGFNALSGDEWYVTGDFNGWNECDEDYRMEANGDGTYTFVIDILEGYHAMRVTNGTWEVSIGGDGRDGNLEFTTGEGELTVVFDKTACTITLSGADVVIGSPPTVSEWYVAGDFNGWEECDANYLMSEEENGIFLLIMDITAGDHSLRVTNGTWDVNYGGDGIDGNVDFHTDDGKLTVVFDSHSFGISLYGANVRLGHKETGKIVGDNWYVAGDFNSWDACDSAYKMINNYDGTFSTTFYLSAGEHQMKITDGTWEESYPKDENFVFEVPGDADVTVIFELGSAVISVEADTAPYEQTWYVSGNFNNWDPCDPDYQMEDDGDGTYSLTFPLEADTYYLRVTDGTWQVSYGDAAEDYCFTVPVDGDVTVHFDGETITVDVPEVLITAPIEPAELCILHVEAPENWGQCAIVYYPEGEYIPITVPMAADDDLWYGTFPSGTRYYIQNEEGSRCTVERDARAGEYHLEVKKKNDDGLYKVRVKSYDPDGEEEEQEETLSVTFWIIVAVVGIVVIGAAVLIIILVARKKKKAAPKAQNPLQ